VRYNSYDDIGRMFFRLESNYEDIPV
jgi:hypothetical protein